ncbi:hypothetical protein [Streptomyces sp. NPDC058486]|uniref:hypothetical protein n=1 Tax=unclassified Streptomyces TaxID=2593676 RepID=UPI00365A19DB
MSQPVSRLPLIAPEPVDLPPLELDPEHRTTLVPLPAGTEETAQRVAFTDALSYGVWGLVEATATRLGLLAATLARRVADRVQSSELAVDVTLDARTATVRVKALGGAMRELLNPGVLPQVAAGDQAGVTRHALGPSVYVKAEVDRP